MRGEEPAAGASAATPRAESRFAAPRLAPTLGGVALVLAAGAATAAPIAPSQASRHVGQSVDVVGNAESVVCSPMACLISFEAGFSGLVVAIPGDAVAAFPDPEATYEGRQVRVHGRVAERNGRPRIEIREPGAIAIVGGVAPGSPAATEGGGRRIVSTRSSSRAPAEVADAPAPKSREDAVGGGAAQGAGGLDAEGASSPGSTAATGDVVIRAETRGAGGTDDASAVPASAGRQEPAVATRSRSRLVPDAAAGTGATAFAGGGRVRVDVATPKPAPLSAEDAAARLGLSADDSESVDGGAPLGGTGELALLRQELAMLSSRLAEVEGAIGELADRVAGIEDVAAPALAERQAREESVGMPPPRSGNLPAMHRVRRGYSAKQVLRVFGEPLRVESNPNGQYTWHYDGGRVVTIDAGGVVVSAVGF